MGLWTTHGCWRGGYGSFSEFRRKLAEVAGLPPLELMEGYYGGREPGLPIRWACLRDDVLHVLLNHPDNEGTIQTEVCEALADRLEQLIPELPDEKGPGHIGHWRKTTQQFADGLRAAAAAGEDVEFL